MAELERLANHFGDIGAICNDAGFAIMLGPLRHPARARPAHRASVFGHRLMMDCIVPGGVGCDLLSPGYEQIRSWYGRSASVPPLVELYDNTALAPEPHRWNRIGKARAHQAIRMRRHYRPGVGARL